jgi:hypothetical protein
VKKENENLSQFRQELVPAYSQNSDSVALNTGKWENPNVGGAYVLGFINYVSSHILTKSKFNIGEFYTFDLIECDNKTFDDINSFTVERTNKGSLTGERYTVEYRFVDSACKGFIVDENDGLDIATRGVYTFVG